ncbi:MAG: O-antigen ligase family protein [Actinobacteria bacterium]|nr:O-antigen ligase family protein [Actinomycetota bacterium]
MALTLGVLVGLSAFRPEILLVVVAAIMLLFVVAGLNRPDPLVFLAFVMMTMPKVHLPGSPLPVGETLMLLAVISAFLTMKKGLFPMPRWAVVAVVLFLTALTLSTVVNGLFAYSAFKRLLHVVVYIFVIIGLVRGLLPRRVALRGIQVGLPLAILSGLVLPEDGYHGRLTGLFGDPNVAGMTIVVLGAIALTGLRSARSQKWYAVMLVFGLALTYSRTAMLGALLALIWLWVGRKLRPVTAVFVVALVAVVIAVVPTNVQNFGPFNDRAGSDQLRNRVASQEIKSVQKAVVLGHGAGTATVLVNNGTMVFYFHDSYLAMIQEGGVVSLAIIMTLLIATFLSLMRLDTEDRQPLLEGSIIGVWVMAINLGEVLMDLPTAIALGFALSYIVRVRARHTMAEPLLDHVAA